MSSLVRALLPPLCTTINWDSSLVSSAEPKLVMLLQDLRNFEPVTSILALNCFDVRSSNVTIRPCPVSCLQSQWQVIVLFDSSYMRRNAATATAVADCSRHALNMNVCSVLLESCLSVSLFLFEAGTPKHLIANQHEHPLWTESSQRGLETREEKRKMSYSTRFMTRNN